MESQGKRLKLFINVVYDGNITACAKDIGIHQSQVSQYVHSKRKIGTTMMVDFENIGGNDYWLMKGKGSMFSHNAKGRELNAKYGHIADALQEESNSGPIFNLSKVLEPEKQPLYKEGVKEITDAQALYIDNARKGLETRAVNIQPSGENSAMLRYFTEPVGAGSKPVLDGGEKNISLSELLNLDSDVLIVRKGIDPLDFDIVLVYIDGELLVKRFRVDKGKKWLVSENAEYLPIELNGDETIEVFGIVQSSIRIHSHKYLNGK